MWNRKMNQHELGIHLQEHLEVNSLYKDLQCQRNHHLLVRSQLKRRSKKQMSLRSSRSESIKKKRLSLLVLLQMRICFPNLAIMKLKSCLHLRQFPRAAGRAARLLLQFQVQWIFMGRNDALLVCQPTVSSLRHGKEILMRQLRDTL